MWSPVVAGRREHYWRDPAGKGQPEARSWASPGFFPGHLPLPLADFNQHLLTVMNHQQECDGFLSSMYPSSELLNLSVVLETLELEDGVKSEGARGNSCTLLHNASTILVGYQEEEMRRCMQIPQHRA